MNKRYFVLFLQIICQLIVCNRVSTGVNVDKDKIKLYINFLTDELLWKMSVCKNNDTQKIIYSSQGNREDDSDTLINIDCLMFLKRISNAITELDLSDTEHCFREDLIKATYLAAKKVYISCMLNKQIELTQKINNIFNGINNSDKYLLFPKQASIQFFSSISCKNYFNLNTDRKNSERPYKPKERLLFARVRITNCSIKKECKHQIINSPIKCGITFPHSRFHMLLKEKINWLIQKSVHNDDVIFFYDSVAKDAKFIETEEIGILFNDQDLAETGDFLEALNFCNNENMILSIAAKIIRKATEDWGKKEQVVLFLKKLSKNYMRLEYYEDCFLQKILSLFC